jgi:hypothetical protein
VAGGRWVGTSYSFSISFCEEVFHKLEVQSADVSVLSCALHQPRVSPASQQSPWIRELRRSVAVSQSPCWIHQQHLNELAKLLLKFIWKNKM